MKRILSIIIFIFCFMPIILACQPSGTNCTTVNGYVGVNVVQAKWNSQNEFKGLESVITKPYFNEEQFFASISVENDEKVMLTSMEIVEEGNKWDMTLTDEEIKILQRITEAEASGQDLESKKNVTSTIINRINSESFPDDVESVVFQKSQFSPIGSGSYYQVEVTEETIQAVDEVLSNGITHECLYFFNMKYISSSKVKRWIDNKLEFQFKDDAGHSYYKESED